VRIKHGRMCSGNMTECEHLGRRNLSIEKMISYMEMLKDMRWSHNLFSETTDNNSYYGGYGGWRKT